MRRACWGGSAPRPIRLRKNRASGSLRALTAVLRAAFYDARRRDRRYAPLRHTPRGRCHDERAALAALRRAAVAFAASPCGGDVDRRHAGGRSRPRVIGPASRAGLATACETWCTAAGLARGLAAGSHPDGRHIVPTQCAIAMRRLRVFVEGKIHHGPKYFDDGNPGHAAGGGDR